MRSGEYLVSPPLCRPYSWRSSSRLWPAQPTSPYRETFRGMSISSNLAFGPRLRAHRERRGMTLGALAESIKIKPSLLEGLERNDVSRWPPGIYRRALVREYARAIGLPADAIVEEFCELFPEPGVQERATPLRHTSVVTGPEAELRLTFASPQTPRLSSCRISCRD